MPRHWFRRPIFRITRQPVRRSKRVTILAVALVLFVLAVIWADAKVRPLVGRVAVAQVHIQASQMINDAVTDYIAGQGLQYGDLVHFEKDVDGSITALKTDMSKINALKANVIKNVNQRLLDMEATVIRIPLGSALSGDLLAGRGPQIPIKLAPYGVVDASFQNSFTAAGINQTRHQVMMNIAVNIGVLLPGSSTDTEVDVQISVAETVIVGRVPDSYAHFNDGEILQNAKAYESVIP